MIKVTNTHEIYVDYDDAKDAKALVNADNLIGTLPDKSEELHIVFAAKDLALQRLVLFGPYSCGNRRTLYLLQDMENVNSSV